MTLEERMRRNDVEDQVEIGLVAERLTIGEPGGLLKMIIEGVKEDTLNRADSDPRYSAERITGALIALNKVQERLDMCVDTKNQLIEEKREEKRVGGSEV